MRWQSRLCYTRHRTNAYDLRLEVEESDIPRSTAWYWRVIDEEGRIVLDGSGETPQHAKNACMRAARKYSSGTRKR